jgi:membrane protein implicated in regulation of membrane protease activity
MTEQELAISNRSYDVAAAIAVGFGAMMIGGGLYFVVGFFAGVLGICSSASASWSSTYDRLLFAIPVFGIFAGLWANQYFSRKRKRKALRKRSARC